jgi:hypothetical protein
MGVARGSPVPNDEESPVTTAAPTLELHAATSAAAQTDSWLAEVKEGLTTGRLAPYLGPGVAALARAPVPTTHEALAAFLGSKVALPRRARGNLGAAAQYIESQRHRTVVVQLMAEAFRAPVAPLRVHDWLAALPSPLIVDTWYDDAMRTALAGRSDWGEIQGVRRSGLGGDAYYAAYDAKGAPCPVADAAGWKTLLYKPHGANAPAKNFLVSDSDYVEVLTEIDIQTPIPAAIQERRTRVGFVFLGCRLNEQTLRAYARQVLKRSGGRHYMIAEPGQLTRNEQRFVAEHGVTLLVHPLEAALERLVAS